MIYFNKTQRVMPAITLCDKDGKPAVSSGSITFFAPPPGWNTSSTKRRHSKSKKPRKQK